jgi:ATP-dependent protease HslVU (ClpYQ) ATPase subunit
MGFKGEVYSEKERNDYLPHATTEDFVEYGLIEELVGRLPVRVFLEDLTKEDLYLILKHSQCAITRQHIRDFSFINVKLEFTDEALKRIADLAIKEKTGARGLMTICENTLSDFKYEMPGKNLHQLTITDETVEDPKKALQLILLHKPLEIFIAQFKNNTGIKLNFTPEAIDYLAEKMSREGMDIVSFCWDKLNGCDRLLEIIDLKEVEINAETLKNPMKEIAAMVQEYRNNIS